MKKLFVFGDSYQADHKQSWLYTKQIANQLSLTVNNFACAGSSLEFTINQVLKCFKGRKIEYDDFVIIGVPGSSRRWLLKLYPNTNHLDELDVPAYLRPFIPPKAACKKFEALRYLPYCESINNETLKNFLYTLDYIFKDFVTKPLLMPSDDRELRIVQDHVKQHNVSFISAQESLNPVARREIINMGIKDYMNFRNDLRKNHFVRENHDILAGILLESFKTGQTFSYIKMKTNVINEADTHLFTDDGDI